MGAHSLSKSRTLMLRRPPSAPVVDTATVLSETGPPRRRRQDASIQALRGLAVILMVAGHVIGIGDRGLRVADESFWSYLYLSMADIRMPLFTLISGYVYAMVPVERWQSYPGLIKGKSRRLILPLITVGTAFYFVKRLVPGTNYSADDVPLWRIYFFGFEHLWFLQSIFVVFLIVGILDATGLLRSQRRWAIATAVSATLFVAIIVPPADDFFTVSGALRLLPFFLLGYGLRRYSVFDLRGTPLVIATAVFAGVYSIRLLTIFDVYHPDRHVDNLIAASVGLIAVVLIYSARHVLNTRLLAWVGGFSFGIYLLHVFATAGTRIILGHIGIHPIWLLFVLGLAMGIAAPIAFQLVFGNVGFIRTFVLGERRRPRKVLEGS
jgi:acyltransferase